MTEQEKLYNFFDWITGGKAEFPYFKDLPVVDKPELTAEQEIQLENMREGEYNEDEYQQARMEVKGREMDDARDQQQAMKENL